jgi:DNA repair protein RadC
MDEFDILHINIEDIKATKQLVAAGRVLDIELVDHIIIGHQRFVSLKEHLRWK